MVDSKLLPMSVGDTDCGKMEAALGLGFKRRQQWPVCH